MANDHYIVMTVECSRCKTKQPLQRTRTMGLVCGIFAADRRDRGRVSQVTRAREINWQEKEAFLYADFLADFRGEFHDIRGNPRFATCQDPSSYTASQKLARELLVFCPIDKWQ